MTRALRLAAAVAAAALLVTATASGRPHGTAAVDSVQISTTLTAREEVPAPTGQVANARGTFAATVTRNGAGGTMDWRLTFTGLTARAIAAHVHIARRGDPGPVVVPLCAPCESPATGSATVTPAVLTALNAGTAYVNVHTPTNTPGEIRGQVGIVANLRTSLNARQEVPRPRRGRVGRARGTFTATIQKSGASASMAWRLSFRRLTGRAVAAHLHIAPRGRSGSVAIALCGPCRSGARGRASVRGNALAAIQSGRLYVNVHTRRNPAGEIRGQLGVARLVISTD